MRLKEICDFVSRGTTPDYVDESPYKVMNQATFSKGWLDESNVRYTSKTVDETLIRKGDLIMASTGGGVLGKVFYYDEDDSHFYADSHVTILRNSRGKNLMKYLYYVFSIKYNEINSTMVKGSTNQTELQRNYLIAYELDIPSLSVQQRIVEYLDAKTKEIDKKIELLGKKRDAYNRLKTATINHAVTRGLDEHVKLKDSSIDWIGQIPEHWVSYRLKDICEFRNGYTPSKGVEEFWKDGTIPWYRMEDIRISGRILKEAQQYITEEAIKTGGLFEADSFIVATTATIGEHARLIADSLANQRFTNLKIRKSLNNIISTDYFFYFLYIVDNFCKINYHFSTFPAVDMFLLRAMPINLPPLEEQKQIAAYLDERCAKIDAAVAIIDKQVDVLKRLKRALINEVVTGKRMI